MTYKLGQQFYILVNKEGEIYSSNGDIKMFAYPVEARRFLHGLADTNYKIAPAKIQHETGESIKTLHSLLGFRDRIEKGSSLRRNL